jgi:hypothetical protein
MDRSEPTAPLHSILFFLHLSKLQLFCDMAKSQTVRSQSIPIQRNLQDIVADAEEKRDVAMADFRDYQFCSRLVVGMKQRQQWSRSVDLKYEIQALIDHIISTRNAIPSPQNKEIHLPPSFSRASLCSLRDNTTAYHLSVALGVVNDEEDDELMFEMDM